MLASTPRRSSAADRTDRPAQIIFVVKSRGCLVADFMHSSERGINLCLSFNSFVVLKTGL